MPKNKYEWMECEVNKLPEDGNVGFYKLLALFPVLIYFICIFFTKRKTEKFIFFISCFLLFLLWLYKFFI